MRPAAWPEPDPQIVAAIAAKYRGKRLRPLAVLIRDQLGQWLADEDFAVAFGTRGRPGWSPSRLALVTVLQRAENLADRQAAEAARTRIDLWVPTISSRSCDQAIFVDHATDASVPSYPVLLENDRWG